MESNSNKLEPQKEVELVDITNEEYINLALKKFSLPDIIIEELNSKYGELKIIDIDDKKGYEEVTKALQDVRPKRTGIEKVRKALNESSLAYTKAVNNEAKRLTEKLQPLEDKLKAEKDRIDDEKERIKREALEAKEKEIQMRFRTLIENGMLFNGEYYAIGEKIKLSVVDIRTMTDELFSNLLSQVKVVFEEMKKEAEKQRIEKEAEAERIKKEQEAIAAQKQEMEKKEKELAERQKQIEEAEAAAKIAKSNARAVRLNTIGLTHEFKTNSFVFSNDFGQISFKTELLSSLEDSGFETSVSNMKNQIDSMKAQQEQKTAKEYEEKVANQKRIDEEVAAAAEKLRKEAEELIAREAPDRENVINFFELLSLGLDNYTSLKPIINAENIYTSFENDVKEIKQFLNDKIKKY